jgi:hypothetical protein
MALNDFIANGEQPAFPEPYINSGRLQLSIKSGLTKREQFAAMAMQGILAGIPQRQQDMIPLLEYYAKQFPDKTMNECVAIESVEMADALLKQLSI